MQFQQRAHTTNILKLVNNVNSDTVVVHQEEHISEDLFQRVSFGYSTVKLRVKVRICSYGDKVVNFDVRGFRLAMGESLSNNQHVRNINTHDQQYKCST